MQYKNAQDKYYQTHKDLCNARSVAWKEANREKTREYARSTRAKWGKEIVSEKRRQQNLKQYGLTIESYNEMVINQGGVCKICLLAPTGRKKNLCVDHCHVTGKVRGLLCDSCNRAIGLLGDDTNLLAKAIEYLLSK
jgi:hypothetical protein